MLWCVLAAYAGLDPRGAAPSWRYVDPDPDGVAVTVQLADVNGDGVADLLVSDPLVDADPALAGPARLRVFFGGAALSAAPDLVLDPVGGATTSGSWGDLDGDGDADQLTFTGNPAARARTLLARLGGPGGPPELASTVTLADAGVPYRWGYPVPIGPLLDVNGDGFGDALLRSWPRNAISGSQRLELHLGGAGGLVAAAAWTYELSGPVFVDASHHIVGDLDADGYRELVTVELDDIDGVVMGSITVTRGDPAGLRDSTWTSVLLPGGVDSIDGYAVSDVGDVTGDGLDDVMVLIRPDDVTLPASLMLYPGDRNYGFSSSAPITVWSAVTTAAPSLLGVGSFDGSGPPDLAIGLSGAVGAADGTGQVLLLRDAAVGYTPIERVYTAAAGERAFGAQGAFGDVNGDGFDDLVVVEGGDDAVPGAVSVFWGYPDADEDGVDDRADCDPASAEVFPGAEEVWHDGVDQDCDGNDADQDLDLDLWPADCDDADASVNHAAAEVWYDGVDQDCDGNDDDQDTDGAVLADDCDDLDPARAPGLVDLVGNGVDEDCDGADAVETGGPEITEPEGCGCDQRGGAGGALLGLIAALAVRRRRGQ